MSATHEDVLRQFALLRKAEQSNPHWSDGNASVLLVVNEGYRLLSVNRSGVAWSITAKPVSADRVIEAINSRMTVSVGD